MLASKTFDLADQARFAALSGDYNPMHMDPVVARRTSAGTVAVHGIHTLLWLLDCIAAQHPEVVNVATLRVRFIQMIHPGDQIRADLTLLTSEALRARVLVDGVEAVIMSATLGPEVVSKTPLDACQDAIPHQALPCDIALKDVQGRRGRVRFVSSPEQMGKAFPHAARLLGARRIAAIGCSTYLVGMIVPGLHSIYGGMKLEMTAGTDYADELSFAVTSVDERFRRVDIEITGGGLSGSLQTVSRPPPVLQPTMDIVAALVSKDEFKDSVALVVGGSRGLGEITAKLIAAGGGKVIITYASGKIDAGILARQITDWGGHCEVLAYDARQEVARQLAPLAQPPTHLYYFATPTIFRRKTGIFVRELLTEFNEFYVHGFLRMVEAGRHLRPAGIVAFYPSSVFVEERPAGMTEYSMSKAAGEILCAELTRYAPGVRIITHRLPRVTTDQTASLIPIKSADPLSVMLPVVRQMHGTTQAL